MSYRLRGEISVDVEDFQYEIEVDVNGPEGISQLMDENNISTAELVEYQNEYTNDDYTPKPTKDDLIAYTNELDFKEIIEILDSYLGTLRYLYRQEQQMCAELQSEKETLKIRIRELEPTPVASVDTSLHTSN